MQELRERSWIATSDFGYVVLDREAAGFFLRSRQAEFPGVYMFDLLGITDGPLRNSLSRNILTLGGEQHTRLRQLVKPSFTPKAADKYRPAMRGFLEQLWEKVADRGQLRLRPRLRQALPRADDRDGRGRAARGRERAAPALQPAAAAVRRDRRDDAPRGARARGRGVRRVRREAGRGPAPQSRRGPRVRADHGRAGRRPAVRRGVPGARARRAERRRRHHAEPALARRAHVRRPPRPVGAAGPRPVARAAGRRGGAALRARRARSPRA